MLLAAFFLSQPGWPQAPGLSTAPPALTAEELKIYHDAHTIIDWIPKEIHAHTEIKRLRPAPSQSALGGILARVGERVAAFVDNFHNTTSEEIIHSDKIEDQRGTPDEVFVGKFRYLLLKNSQGGWSSFQEYRTDAQGHTLDTARARIATILTSQFPLLVMYFDPHLRGACRYRCFGRQHVNGKEANVVGCAQIPTASFPPALFDDGCRTVRTLLQGLAWISVDSQEILLLQTDLLAPPPHSSLQQETTQIDYAPVPLSQTAAAFVLPKKVAVDLWLQGGTRTDVSIPVGGRLSPPPKPKPEIMHYRTTHVYSDYRLFRVESHIGPTLGATRRLTTQRSAHPEPNRSKSSRRSSAS
jgi:hypothetical protein